MHRTLNVGKNFDRKTHELLVLAAWAHDEISIGRARELLGWTDTKIQEQAEKRVSNAARLKEERDELYWKSLQYENHVAASDELRAAAKEFLEATDKVWPPEAFCVTTGDCENQDLESLVAARGKLREML